ncbi:MAG: hypothetical protein IPL31_05885 [Saprospiraceae bacterium]|nr:hypothetical protein [Saprospiraceae bacterium]
MTTQNIKLNIVCAMHPNANGFGFVYIDNEGKLVYFGSVRISPISNRKILERIKKSLDYFKPKIVILLDPDSKSSRTGNRTKRLIKKITDYADSENLPVFQYTRDQIRDVFEIRGAFTKYEISKFLLTKFPELEPKRPRKRKMGKRGSEHGHF